MRLTMLFRSKKPSVHYLVILNDETFTFDSLSKVKQYLSDYRSKFNEIFSLSIFKVKMYNLTNI